MQLAALLRKYNHIYPNVFYRRILLYYDKNTGFAPPGLGGDPARQPGLPPLPGRGGSLSLLANLTVPAPSPLEQVFWVQKKMPGCLEGATRQSGPDGPRHPSRLPAGLDDNHLTVVLYDRHLSVVL